MTATRPRPFPVSASKVASMSDSRADSVSAAMGVMGAKAASPVP